MTTLFKPTEAGRRDPSSDKQQNGRITNPPRYAKIGGFTSAKKGLTGNNMRIVPPGNGTK